MVETLEEGESEVECKCCFDLFPKEDCVKTDKGYICQKCNQEMHSHQGTNLDLIDADPFDLNYDDPRNPEKKEEPEVKEKPVDATEVRKHEAGIKEQLFDTIKTEWDVYDYYVNSWLACDIDDEILRAAFERGLKGKDLPAKWYDRFYSNDMDYLEDINSTGQDIKAHGIQSIIVNIVDNRSDGDLKASAKHTSIIGRRRRHI